VHWNSVLDAPKQTKDFQSPALVLGKFPTEGAGQPSYRERKARRASARRAPPGFPRLRSGQARRLRATRAVSCDSSVRRSAQDDGFVGILTKVERKLLSMYPCHGEPVDDGGVGALYISRGEQRFSVAEKSWTSNMRFSAGLENPGLKSLRENPPVQLLSGPRIKGRSLCIRARL
jgi:hypothetical protein